MEQRVIVDRSRPDSWNGSEGSERERPAVVLGQILARVGAV